MHLNILRLAAQRFHSVLFLLTLALKRRVTIQLDTWKLSKETSLPDWHNVYSENVFLSPNMKCSRVLWCLGVTVKAVLPHFSTYRRSAVCKMHTCMIVFLSAQEVAQFAVICLYQCVVFQCACVVVSLFRDCVSVHNFLCKFCFVCGHVLHKQTHI